MDKRGAASPKFLQELAASSAGKKGQSDLKEAPHGVCVCVCTALAHEQIESRPIDMQCFCKDFHVTLRKPLQQLKTHGDSGFCRP